MLHSITIIFFDYDRPFMRVITYLYITYLYIMGKMFYIRGTPSRVCVNDCVRVYVWMCTRMHVRASFS